MKRIVTTMLCGFYLYAHRGARYFAGVAIHSRQFPVDSDSENSSSDASCDVSKNHEDDSPARHTSCAWWLYGEQPLWTTDGKAVLGMVQYSENTNRNSTCYRYAEVAAPIVTTATSADSPDSMPAITTEQSIPQKSRGNTS